MFGLPRARLVFCFTVAAIATASLVSACTDETTDVAGGGDAGDDGPTRRRDGSSGPVDEEDADVDPEKDSGADGAEAGKDANGPGADGDPCDFNRDCQLALRCECEEGNCECKPGARGTGKNGVDTCTSANDCASSICAEGPIGSFCSDECANDSDCTGNLPKCFPIIGFPEAICWFKDED